MHLAVDIFSWLDMLVIFWVLGNAFGSGCIFMVLIYFRF